MQSRTDKADMLHKKGYNCAQSVACAFCGLTGTDETLVFRLTEGCGLGMGNMKGTCGAITGAIAVAGMVNSTGNTDSPDSKGSTYKLSRRIMDAFYEKNNSTVCCELKGIGTGIPLRSCPGCIKDACEILESIFSEE